MLNLAKILFEKDRKITELSDIKKVKYYKQLHQVEQELKDYDISREQRKVFEEYFQKCYRPKKIKLILLLLSTKSYRLENNELITDLGNTTYKLKIDNNMFLIEKQKEKYNSSLECSCSIEGETSQKNKRIKRYENGNLISIENIEVDYISGKFAGSNKEKFVLVKDDIGERKKVVESHIQKSCCHRPVSNIKEESFRGDSLPEEKILRII